MAEAFGIFTGALTLPGYVIELGKFVKEFKDSSQQLERYLTVLQSIEISCNLISHLSKQSTHMSSISMQVDGERKNLTEFFTNNISMITSDARKLLESFKAASNEASVLNKLKAIFKRTRLVFSGPQIDNLIQAAKHIESSFQMGLAYLLLFQNNFTQPHWNGIYDNLKETLIEQFSLFKEQQEKIKCEKAPVLSLKATKNRKKPIGHRNILESTKKPSQELITQLKNRPVAASSLDTHHLSIEKTNSHAESEIEEQLNVLTPNASILDTDSINSVEEDVAIIYIEGRVKKKHDFESSEYDLSSLHNKPPSMVDSLYAPPSDISSEKESIDLNLEDLTFLDDFDMASVADSSTSCSSKTLYDSMELALGNKATIFFDEHIILNHCKCLETDGFRFCVKVLIMNESEPPLLILKDPCRYNSGKCNHISVEIGPEIVFHPVFPISLHVELIPANPENREECVRLLVVQSCAEKDSHTLTISREGSCEQYAIGICLSISSIIHYFEDGQTRIEEDAKYAAFFSILPENVTDSE